MQSPGPCDLPLCGRYAEATVRLIVDDDLLELVTCASHAHWLRQYVGEDAAVTLLEEQPVFADGDIDA